MFVGTPIFKGKMDKLRASRDKTQKCKGDGDNIQKGQHCDSLDGWKFNAKRLSS